MPRKPARHGRFRDALIVAGVLALAGVALTDALRGDGSEPAAGPAAATTPATTEPDPFRPRQGVPAPGSLVLLDADGCVLRQIIVASGQELPLPPLTTGCELWAAPRGGLVAYALEGPYGEFQPFRLVDLSHPDEPLGTFQAFGGVRWRADGQRAAWCHDQRRGVELAPRSARGPRPVRGCPVAYAPDGRPAFAQGDRLVVGGDAVYRASARIVFAEWVANGSLVLVLADRRLQRIVDGQVAISLLGAPTDRRPEVAPDGCGVAFAAEGRIELWNLCAEPRPPATVDGTAAAWSPDGRWLAVTENDELAFVHREGRLETTRWPVAARAVAWVR